MHIHIHAHTEGGLYAGTCFVTTALKDAMQTKVLDMARTAAATQLAQKTKGGGAAHGAWDGGCMCVDMEGTWVKEV